MRRSGYTLLEILLALTIAVLLLAALYVSVDMQLRLAQAGRNRVEESTVVRSIFARMDDDASCVIGLADTARFRAKQSSSSGRSSTGAYDRRAHDWRRPQPAAPLLAAATTGDAQPRPATGTTGAATTGDHDWRSSSTGSSTITSMSTTGTVSTYTNSSGVQVVILPYGVIGDSQHLNMFISRVPREMINAQLQQQEGSVPLAGDLRRVSYWLIGDNGSGQGLAKQEVKLVTADDAGAIDQSVLPPSNGSDNPEQYLFVEEVKSLQFEYYDGTEWNESWDSTQPGADGVTPLGSPVAIRITVGLAQPGKPDAGLKSYQHVITFLTANGTTTMPQTGTSTNPSTTGGGTTSP